ncbi:hypothetical protein [Pseudodesulfovibrio sp.]|uniref:hypothetical protein n=1 Tax=unclassified Pseudodesulfovibrio TaxID=2661612 RepID=UPI003B0025E7
MFDSEVWIVLFVLTAILYSIKWWQGSRKVKVYRISQQSLERSKEVMLKVLPLVEDGEECVLDCSRLPYAKDTVKSAAKILAYYYWKENCPEELGRVKRCFVSLGRFQRRAEDEDHTIRLATREKKQLNREMDYYLTHYPFRARAKSVPAEKK